MFSQSTRIQSCLKYACLVGTAAVLSHGSPSEASAATTATASSSASSLLGFYNPWSWNFWYFFNDVRPVLNCVDDLGNGKFAAHWGYENNGRRVSIPRGWWNGVWPANGQKPPKRFKRGTHEDVFVTNFDGADSQTWWLMWDSATATKDSPRCKKEEPKCTPESCDDSNPCTVDSCDPEVGCSNEALPDYTLCQDGGGHDVKVCRAGLCKDIKVYSEEHGDIAFEVEVKGTEGEIEVLVEAEGATIDGVAGVDGEFDPNEIVIVTNAKLTRPTGDNGAFEPLCVAEGESVYWLPQDSATADAKGVPFVGIALETQTGVLSNDQAEFALLDVDSPDIGGSYALWKSGNPPKFIMSSCNGIDTNDSIVLPLGHDHYNMGFAGDKGLWRVTYAVTGKVAASGEPVSKTFTVNYLLRD